MCKGSDNFLHSKFCIELYVNVFTHSIINSGLLLYVYSWLVFGTFARNCETPYLITTGKDGLASPSVLAIDESVEN
jgi:hypothetical protein